MFDENEHIHPQNNDEGPRHPPGHQAQRTRRSGGRQRRFLLAGASPPQSTAETDTDASV